MRDSRAAHAATFSSLIVAASLVFALAGLPLTQRLQQFMGTAPSVHLMSGIPDSLPTLAATHMLVIAHNAGDTAPTSHTAQANGAGAIEIDVRLADSQLRAAHSQPRLAELVDTGRPLATAWNEVRSPAVLLDIKTSTVATTDLLSAMMISERASGRVIVSTPDGSVLERLERQAPTALRLRTTRTAIEIANVLVLPGAAQGVAVPARLLSPSIVGDLRTRGLWIQAYTVNSMTDVNRLAKWGVDGITTDNLQVMSALSTKERITNESVVLAAGLPSPGAGGGFAVR